MLTAPLQICKTPPPNEATCWPWVVTHKALGQIPGGWAVIDPVTEWSMACNTSLWPLLGLTGGRIRPDPINRLVPTCPSMWFCLFFFTFPIVSYNLLLWNYLIYFCGTISDPLFSICARRRGLRVNCTEVGLMTAVRLLFFKKHNLAEAQNHTLCMSILVLYPRLSQGEWVAPLVHSLLKLESIMAGGA